MTRWTCNDIATKLFE